VDGILSLPAILGPVHHVALVVGVAGQDQDARTALRSSKSLQAVAVRNPSDPEGSGEKSGMCIMRTSHSSGGGRPGGSEEFKLVAAQAPDVAGPAQRPHVVQGRKERGPAWNAYVDGP
jgi:hypothetical protein